MIFWYEIDSGKIRQASQGVLTPVHHGIFPEGSGVAVIELDADASAIDTHYISNGVLIEKPPRPSEKHSFDYATKQWVDLRTIDDLKAPLLVQVNDARIAYSTAPIEYAGRLVDADLTAQTNINNKLLELAACKALGVDMNPDLMLWRDADNLNVSFSTMDDMERWLQGLVAKIAERGTQCYIWSWNIKASIEAAATVDEFPTITM